MEPTSSPSPSPSISDADRPGSSTTAASSRGRDGLPDISAHVFRRAAWRVALAGTAVVLVALVAGACVGGPAWAGALWGGGAGLVMTAVTAAALACPWDRFPLLASSGVMLSFAAKIAVMVAVVLIAGPHRQSFSAGWFFGAFAVNLLTVTLVEIVSLARARTLTVELTRD